MKSFITSVPVCDDFTALFVLNSTKMNFKEFDFG